MVLLSRGTVNDSIHGLESQTPELLERAGQVKSGTAMFVHVFVRVMGLTLAEPLYGEPIFYNDAEEDPLFQ